MVSSSLSFLFLSIFLMHVASVIGASNVNGPYSDPSKSYGLTFTVQSPPELKGSISFSPWANSRSPVSSMTGRVVLPMAADSATGCDQNGNPKRFTPLNYNNNGNNSNVQDEHLFLIVFDGLCYPDFTGLNISAAINIMNPFLTISGPVSYLIPVLSPMVYTDIMVVYNYLLSASSSLSSSSSNSSSLFAPVIATIIGSGPLVDDEKQALKLIANSLTYTTDYNQNAANRFGVSASTLFPYPSSPSYDPCISVAYMGGLYCEDGHIVSIYFWQLGLMGEFPASFAAFTRLRYLYLDDNLLSGNVSALCVWSSTLTYLSVSGNLLSQLPDCFTSTTRYFAARSNRLTSLPQTLVERAAETLIHLDVSNNLISSFPSLFSMSALMYLDLSSNNALATIFSFHQMTAISYIDLHSNHFSGVVDPSWFDDLVFLTYVDLSFNNISGPFPNFNRSTQIQYMALDHNLLSGPCPLSLFALTSLTTLTASHNRLTYGLDGQYPLLNAVSLKILDLSFNSLTVPALYYPELVAGGFANFLSSSMSSAVLTTLKLDGNALSGAWTVSYINNAYFPVLSYLSLSHNNITNLPSDLFAQYVPYQHLDVSYNALTGSIPLSNGPPSSIQYLSFIGNPFLVASTSSSSSSSSSFSSSSSVLVLPFWLSQSSSSYHYDSLLLQPFSCPDFEAVTYPELSLFIDPTYVRFQGCRCENGYYGNPPVCTAIPASVALVRASANFSDSDFGNQRYSAGLDSSWLISPSGARTITLTLTLFPTVFNSSSDQVTVYDGPTSTANVVLTAVGGGGGESGGGGGVMVSGGSSGRSSRSSVSTGNINGNDGGVVVEQVTVVSSAVQVTFKSKATQGQHFILSFTHSENCPQSYKLDHASNQCIQVLPLYSVSSTLQIVVFVTSGMSSVFIFSLLFFVLYFRSYVIIRAAALPFCILMIIGLLMMSASSVLYAVDGREHVDGGDSESESGVGGDVVCNARAWCTGLAVVTVLAPLITKANRIRVIFTHANLSDLLRLSNWDLVKSLSVMFFVELTLLSVLSGLPLTWSSAVVGSGATAGYTVNECASAPNYDVWIAAQLGYVAILLIGGLYIAWSTRKVPSAYNESSHILNSLHVLLSLGLIVIVLQFVVADDPNTLMIIRGLGQNLVALSLTFTLFAPKIYVILDGRGNDKNQLTSSFKSQMRGTDNQKNSSPIIEHRTSKRSPESKSDVSLMTVVGSNSSVSLLVDELSSVLNSSVDDHYRIKRITDILKKHDVSRHSGVTGRPVHSVDLSPLFKHKHDHDHGCIQEAVTAAAISEHDEHDKQHEEGGAEVTAEGGNHGQRNSTVIVHCPPRTQ